MTYDWAKPGAKVVCVNADDCCGLLVQDQLYTIRDIRENETPATFMGVDKGIHIIVRLEGFDDVINKMDEINEVVWKFEGFNIQRFKPLVSKPKELPQTLTCLLHNPKRIVLPDEFDFQKHYDPV